MIAATGCAQYQLGRQDDPPLQLVVRAAVAVVADHIEEHAGSAASQLQCGLPDRGERGVEQRSQFKVIEADHCQVRGQAQLHGADRLQCVDGGDVVQSEQGGRPVGLAHEASQQCFRTAGGCQVGPHLGLQAGLFHCAAVAEDALVDGVDLGIVADAHDTAMAMGDQVPDCLLRASLVLYDDLAGVDAFEGAIKCDQRNLSLLQLAKTLVRAAARGHDEQAGDAPCRHHRDLV